MIQALLQNQPADRTPGVHHYIETAGYLKCQHCTIAILGRSNETIWNDFINSACADERYNGETIGHETHLLWQLGHRVSCKHTQGAPVKKSPNLRVYFPTQLNAQQGTPKGGVRPHRMRHLHHMLYSQELFPETSPTPAPAETAAAEEEVDEGMQVDYF